MLFSDAEWLPVNLTILSGSHQNSPLFCAAEQMRGGPGMAHAFSIQDIFNLQWVCCDVTPLQVLEYLYTK
jgi:hypothetical protein